MYRPSGRLSWRRCFVCFEWLHPRLFMPTSPGAVAQNDRRSPFAHVGQVGGRQAAASCTTVPKVGV